jgi:hypothetical protein
MNCSGKLKHQKVEEDKLALFLCTIESGCRPAQAGVKNKGREECDD